MRTIKRLTAIIVLALVASLGAPQAFAGQMGTGVAADGGIEMPGYTGTAESPGITGDIGCPGFAGDISSPGLAAFFAAFFG